MATTLGAVAEGSIVYLNESGVAVPFYVAKHNYESALNGDGRTLLVRRDAWGTTMAWDAGDVNAYSGSDVDVWLNGTYKALLDSFVQTAMSTTTFYYTPGNGNLTVATLTRAVFLLSVTELEATYSYANIEGTALATASNLKIAYSNGTAVAQWTRSPYTSGVERACTLNTAGNAGGAFCSGAQRPRPAFALPASELWVDSSNNITNKKPTEPTGSYTKLEYIESSGTQFINSNYTPTENTRVVTTVRFKSTPSNNTTVFGTRSANTLQFWVFYRPNANGFAYRFGDTSDMPSVTADPTVTHVIDANKNILTVDATSTTATADTISTTYPLYLLASNNAGTAEGLASAYLYSCQIYDNNTLVRDFIPARRNSDGAIGLLDQANNVFYANAGTGTFTAGPEIASTGSLANINGTSVLLTGCLANIDGIECAIPYALANVDGIEVVIPFGEQEPDYSDVLDENTPEMIAQAAIDGVAPDLWDVGDTVGIALNGTVGALAFSNETYYAFILGFDHNPTIEGYGTIHFQMAKTAAGVDIAFCDSNYGSTGSSAGFRMNTSKTNSGGWNNSYMRSTICPAFKAAMPTAWQNVIAACTKYSDNTGGGSDTASYVTSTSDKIWLLAEFEVFGTRSVANSAEKNYQKQYDYYANGNSKIKYKHSDTATACIWWLRSVVVGNSTGFRLVATSGSGGNTHAYYPLGFAPCFVVGNAA